MYELSVPPNAVARVSHPFSRGTAAIPPTGIIQDPSLGPVLDDHGQRADPLVNFHIGFDHPCIFERESIIHVHVASEAELWIPNFHDRNFSMRYAHHPLHSIYVSSAVSPEAPMSVLTVGQRFREEAYSLQRFHGCGNAYID